jgi:hypothetical protein
VVRLSPAATVVDGRGPLGLRLIGRAALGDPVMIDSALRNVDQLDGFSSATLLADLHRLRPVIWLQAAFVGAGEATSPTIAMLDATAGARPLRTWRIAAGDEDLIVAAYAVDVDGLALPDGRTYANAAAVATMARLLDGIAGTDGVAGRLLGRLVVVPPGAEASAARESLGRVAQGLPAAP